MFEKFANYIFFQEPQNNNDLRKRKRFDSELPMENNLNLYSIPIKENTILDEDENPKKTTTFSPRLESFFRNLNIYWTLIKNFVNTKKKYWLEPEGQSDSKKSRLRTELEWFFYYKKYTIAIWIILILALFFCFKVAKIGWKYVNVNCYIDSQNRSIIDPFEFENAEIQWNIRYNLHNRDLVEWVAGERSPDPKTIKQEDILNGFFHTNIIGQDRSWNVSFEVLLSKFRHYANELGPCARADNFGIPSNILYFVSTNDDHNTEFMLIEPTVNPGERSIEEIEAVYEMRDDSDPNVKLEYTMTSPSQLRAYYLSYSTGTHTSKIFYEQDAACIYRFARR